MTALFTLLFLSAILASAGCAWALICNERTYRQRILLIDAISEAIAACELPGVSKLDMPAVMN